VRLLGIIVLGIVCVVMAFKRRTVPWIVAGVLGGLLAAVITTTFTVAVIRGIQPAMEREASFGLEADGSTTSSRPPATEVVRGRDMPYSIRVSVTWTTKTEVDDFDTLSSRKSLYGGVIAEEADLGDPETIAGIARKKIKDVGTEIRWDEPAPLALDGRSWLQFTVDCKVEKVPVTYQFYVYSGKRGCTRSSDGRSRTSTSAMPRSCSM
jgi:hypothetical protein